MNNALRLLIGLLLLNISFSENQNLWDLGIIIEPNNNYLDNEKNIIKPLISNTKIKPQYKTSLDPNLLDEYDAKINPKHKIKLLYWNNEYFRLTQYIKQNQTSMGVMADEQLLIYADALYQLGKYNHAIETLNLLSNKYPVDEKYFLLAQYNKKAGNKEYMLNLLNNLLSEYPDSEYAKLAKLQTYQRK